MEARREAKRATTACRCVFGKMCMGYDHFICVESLGHHACGEVGPAHPTGPSGFGADRVISRSRTTGRLYRGASCCARGGGWPPGSRLRQTMAPQKAMHSGHRTGAVVLWCGEIIKCAYKMLGQGGEGGKAGPQQGLGLVGVARVMGQWCGLPRHAPL